MSDLTPQQIVYFFQQDAIHQSNPSRADVYSQTWKTIEQQQQRIAELEAERDSVCHLNDALSLERDALAAALSLAKQMFHDYEMDVDCPAPTEHKHKMKKMQVALAERDAEQQKIGAASFKAELQESVKLPFRPHIEGVFQVWLERAKRGEG